MLVLTTARIAAFMPGLSPPEVSIPMFLMLLMMLQNTKLGNDAMLLVQGFNLYFHYLVCKENRDVYLISLFVILIPIQDIFKML